MCGPRFGHPDDPNDRAPLGRLGFLVALVAGASAASFDIAPLTGVYAGSRTVDVLAVDPTIGSATIQVTADPDARTVPFTLAADGDSPVVVPGTYTEAGLLTASNTIDASRLPIEVVVDPSGTVRGTYTRLGDEPGTSVTGGVEGTWTADLFVLALVEPEEGGVRVEVRTFRELRPRSPGRAAGAARKGSSPRRARR